MNLSAGTWRDLSPDTAFLRALDVADAGGSRADAILGGREPRNNWSNRFADACAVMVADGVRRNRVFSRFVVRPAEGGPAEPLTFVAGDREKKVDVVVSSIVSGLQVGFSLKGMNFRDGAGHQFDKNLTGRTYELQDEVSVIHRYQPAAMVVALYFMPLAATVDKRSVSSPSSFARTVAHLRARTGRIDPTLPSQIDRVDAAFVALFVAGDHERSPGVVYDDDVARGVIRFFDVLDDPPKRGRPMLTTTLDLDGMIARIARRFDGAETAVTWADPEP